MSILKDSSCTHKNYCYVCKTPQTKISRHFKKHKNEEPEIAQAFLFPKHSKERKGLLEKLRNKGNYDHNQEVMMHQKGPLKVKRRPGRSSSLLETETYVYCAYCRGMFIRKELWRHTRRCPSRPLSEPEATRPNRTKVLPLADTSEKIFPQAVSPGVLKVLGGTR